MNATITTIYCLCEEFLKAMHHRDDPQVRLSTAEVVTVPLVASTLGSNTARSSSLKVGPASALRGKRAAPVEPLWVTADRRAVDPEPTMVQTAVRPCRRGR